MASSNALGCNGTVRLDTTRQPSIPAPNLSRCRSELLSDLALKGLRTGAVTAFVLDDLSNEPCLDLGRVTAGLHLGGELASLERLRCLRLVRCRDLVRRSVVRRLRLGDVAHAGE